MGWKGLAFGGWLGSLFGGPLGAVLGAALGHEIEKKMSGGARTLKAGGAKRPSRSSHPYSRVSQEQRAKIFCASAAAMLAKLAKADGVVTQSEIAAVEAAFRQLGFSRDARAYAINVFRRAKDDSHTIYEYAADFAVAVESVEVREIFYGLLWDLAGADGAVSSYELYILQKIPLTLGIRLDWFDIYRAERLGERRSRTRSFAETDPLETAYQTLGISPRASDDEVKKAYRALAKKNHPDLLRAQGLPEELIGKATEKMGHINEAWRLIREKRNI